MTKAAAFAKRETEKNQARRKAMQEEKLELN